MIGLFSSIYITCILLFPKYSEGCLQNLRKITHSPIQNPFTASHLLSLLQLSGSSRSLITSLASLLPLSLFAHSAPGSPTPSVLLEHSKLKGSQSLCLCLEHFFSSSGLCSNDTYQRLFLPTPYKMPSSTSPLPLRVFSSEHFLLSLILHVCLLSLSHARM